MSGVPDEDNYRGLTLGEAVKRFAHHHLRSENRHISQDEAAFLLRAAEVLDELGCAERVGRPGLFD